VRILHGILPLPLVPKAPFIIGAIPQWLRMVLEVNMNEQKPHCWFCRIGGADAETYAAVGK